MAGGGEIKELQFNLGHSSVRTTEIYLQELGVDVNRAYNGVSPLQNKFGHKAEEQLPNGRVDKVIEVTTGLTADQPRRNHAIMMYCLKNAENYGIIEWQKQIKRGTHKC